ncbi:MAG: RNA polymerase sigma factor, partial [candidate division WOR-3 bacterium]
MKFNFEEVYQAYKDMVYNFVLWKVKSHEDALDLSQEIFFKVYKNLKNFREESSIKTWIMKIAMNHVKDFYKKQGKRMLDME